MITLLAILLTWYLTKVYYTRSLRLSIDELKKNGLIEAQCSKCAKFLSTTDENIRTPFYCASCK